MGVTDFRDVTGGEPSFDMYDIIDHSTNVMPKDKPRYLMGVGTPENILTAIEMGVDTFDCVMPTRNARNGTIFTTRGRMNVRNLKNKFSNEPIDPGLDLYASREFSLGYLRHLFTVGEIVGLQLATLQNVGFYMWLVREARTHILNNTYSEWKTSILDIIR